MSDPFAASRRALRQWTETLDPPTATARRTLGIRWLAAGIVIGLVLGIAVGVFGSDLVQHTMGD